MPKRLKKLDAGKYRWRELSGLREVLDFVSSKTVSDDVELINTDRARFNPVTLPDLKVFSRWGNRLQWVDAAVEFTDGSIMLCAHISAWNGTFAEDTNHTKYYGLER
jgi:hypothetical protein